MVIPATDWLGGPESRLHRIFEGTARKAMHIEIMHINLTRKKIRKSNHTIHSFKTINTQGRTGVFYLLNLALLWICSTAHVLKKRPDIIVTTNPVLSFPVVFLKRLIPLNLVFDYVDDISGLAMEYIPRIFAIPITRVVRVMLQSVLKASDQVIVSSKFLEKKAKSFLSASPIYIPNGVDVSHFSSFVSNNRNELIIGYVGGIYEWSGIDEFISTYSDVRRVYPSIEYHIYGAGIAAPRIQLQAFEQDGVFYHGEIPYKEVPRIMSQFRIGIIPFLKTPLTDGATPLKLFEYWATGVPVISRELEEVRRIGQNACLFFHTKSDMKDRILQLLSDEQLSNLLTQSGYTLVKHYDWGKITNEYYNALSNVLRESNTKGC